MQRGIGLVSDDTWTYDGSDWTQVTTAHAPSPRAGCAMAYDSNRNVTVLFGGILDTNWPPDLYDDTWEFDGTDWTEITNRQCSS